MRTEDPRRTVRIAVPAGWERVADPAPGVLLLAAPRRPVGEACPSMAVSVADLEPGWSRTGWLERFRAELASSLAGFDVEDEDSFDLDGFDVDYLRLAHRDGGRELVSEVWVWLCEGRAWSVSGTIERSEYGAWCEVFEGVAATFDPEASAA
ncbi:hypothetical protein EKO23_08215 [Nocardioides guangzhouensis]|uniref:DUF1795 domain-containing protein n=1 Tax=Nocardioides guangzhouensis TaxID=2497878 RepID=A0A4Q4ZER7_9ACTN|nr:hypothetical protein [Nocardioides guangzhouensis]RYP86650.1 hypothetical protein EKO23_08215 [Nocardioides guangzhouensis]